MIQYEPTEAFEPEQLGLLRALGIEKGKEFNPDERMKNILDTAAKTGLGMARAIAYQSREPEAKVYPDRNWEYVFVGGSHEFMSNGELVLNDRVSFHFAATGITPAMAMPKVGTGSAYEAASCDSQGRYLDGGKIYSVTLPVPIPANNFWSFMVYSGQHRSMLETDQKSAGLDSNSPTVKRNNDGSYTIWFGPTSPEGHEGNWIQTIPGKSYFVLLRLYGPLQAWFDKSWKPGDFELVE